MLNIFLIVFVCVCFIGGMYQTISSRETNDKYIIILNIILSIIFFYMYFFNKTKSTWEWQVGITKFPQIVAGSFFLIKSLLNIYFRNINLSDKL